MKLLLIGWDAADWSLVQRLLDRGLMPRLAEFASRGVRADLWPVRPHNSASMWMSLATGERACAHGVLTPLEANESGSAIRPASRRTLRAAPLWSDLSAAGYRVQTYGWPATHPAESLNGVAVSDQFADLGESPSIYPSALFHTLRELRLEPADIDAASLQTLVPRASELNPLGDQRLYVIARFLASTASLHAAATWGLEHEPWDFAAVRYEGLARLKRVFSNSQLPAHSEAAGEIAAVFGDVLANACQFFDMMLGRLVQLAGPDTTVVLVAANSPPSGDASFQGVNPEPWKLIVIPASRSRAFSRLRTILDLAPSILNGFEAGQRKPFVGIQPFESDPKETSDAKGASEDESVAHLLELGYCEQPDPYLRLAIKNIEQQRRARLAEALLDSRQYLESAPILAELVRAEPRSTPYRSMLAEAYFHLGRYDECRKLVLEMGTEGVDTPLARIALAALDLLEGRGEPVAHLKRAEAIGGGSAQQLVLMGRLYLGLRRRTDAARILDAAIALEPRSAAAHAVSAIVDLYAGDAVSAERHARMAIQLHGDFADAHYFLGLALAKQGRPKEAIECFKTGVSLDTHNAGWAHGRLADLYDRQGAHALAYHHRAICDRSGRARRPTALNLQGFMADLF